MRDHEILGMHLHPVVFNKTLFADDSQEKLEFKTEVKDEKFLDYLSVKVHSKDGQVAEIKIDEPTVAIMFFSVIEKLDEAQRYAYAEHARRPNASGVTREYDKQYEMLEMLVQTNKLFAALAG